MKGGIMKSLFRRKSVNHANGKSDLKPVLGGLDITLLGIGAIIGAGVFVVTGIAAATKAGPAISLSYVLAGMAALFAALSYAELSSSVGGSGSAYNYAYTGFGELIAWIIGWALLLEYTMAVSSVSVGWSGYVINGLEAVNIHLPMYLTKDPFSGGIINLPAAAIILVLTYLLYAGVKQSARFNAVIVAIKLITIAIFIGVASTHVDPKNWEVFLPFGWNGVAQGAALVFFAYIGFDALSTAAEETIKPQRNLPIGIIASLLICTVIYVVVSVLLTGVSNYTTLNVPSPVSDALLHLGFKFAAGVIAVGAIAGLTTVMLVMYYGLTRILFAISRDGLLPVFFSKVNPETQTPTRSIVSMGILISLVAGFVPLADLAELVNIGTLTAFIFVCLGVIVMRYRHPELPRPFKLPWNPVIPLLGVIFCGYLMIHLSEVTWYRFITWMLIGLVIYFGYSRSRSVLAK